MSTPTLHKAYDSNLFAQDGQALIILLENALEDSIQERRKKVTTWVDPEEEYSFWSSFEQNNHTTQDLFDAVLSRSIHTHHPKYIGHQVAPTVPVSALATMVSAQLNNGMAVYEMGQASTAIEKVVIKKFTDAIGWQEGDGFLTSGGTLANLTGLLAARKAKAPSDVWNEGHTAKLAIMVSAEAHYCVDRAARIMGLGDNGIIHVPVDENYKMRADLLEEQYNKAVSEGLEVIAVVGSAPSTSTGIHDDLMEVSAFAKAKNIWFHIDAAHGGAAIFSSKYKSLLKGIKQADSVIIDGHKMMGTSAITTAVLYKNSADSYATFSQKAQYLWEQNEDPEWFNMAKRTFECTKSMMSLKFFAIWNAYGNQFFDDFVTTLYDAARQFSAMIEQDPNFELFLQPESNIVCFRYVKDIMSSEFDVINKKIRQTLLEDGAFYIVATQLKTGYYLRTTFMNPFTTGDHMKQLLDKIKRIAGEI